MTRLALLAVVGCGSMATSPPPVAEPTMTIGNEGWCGTGFWHPSVYSRDGVVTITVAADTLADAPAVPDPKWQHGAQSWLGSKTAYTYSSARLRKDVVELVSPSHGCEDTSLGCIHGRSGRWGGEVYAKASVPPGTCIQYFVELAGGRVLGTSTGTFAVPNSNNTPTPIVAPILEYVAELPSRRAVLQEQRGPMWSVTWDAAAAAPVFTRVAAVDARTLAFAPWNEDAYAFTSDALITLDSTTLVEKWRLPGEVHAVLIPESGRNAAFVRVDRSNPDQQRVVLDVRSQKRGVPGPILRSRVVYEGPTIVDADLRLLDDTTYEVAVAPF